MTDKEIDADAWQRKDDAYFTYPPMWHMAVDTNYDEISRFKPLFSSETIQEGHEKALQQVRERTNRHWSKEDLLEKVEEELKEVFSQ